MSLFYFIIYTLTLTFALAGFLTWRENNAKRDMERDIKAEFKKKNGIK